MIKDEKGISAVTVKHTPGPWIACKGAGWIVTRPNATARREAAIGVGITPATTIVGDPVVPWYEEGEAEANAYLMAAAPDLLAVVHRFVRIHIEMGSTSEAHEWEEEKLIDEARAAIAKATQPSTEGGKE